MNEKTKQKWALAYEITLVSLAFISVLFIWTDNVVLMVIDRFIWLAFFIDVLIRFTRARKKMEYVKRNPFDIIAAIPLDAIFQTARIVRLFRVLRFFAITRKYLGTVRSIIKTNGLDLVLTATFVLIFGAAIIVKEVEPNMTTYLDGVWWALVTTTTVGYGDISPETGTGRIVAVILMFVGIGLIGMITSSITTFFLKGKEEKDETVVFIQKQLDRFEELSDKEVNRLIVLLEEMKKEKEL
ncbi:potassium channel family protein [Salimicrobium halophilum]|uniref:Voltage-gated potassium channel n=1 Tax=Salimicrobium halophilum TaxID=86666 RepID=A0A1G8T3C5_9BACI|nr:potassium channel family protein [Salimicrobium halophilum]SDJ35986.1 voltage-gated potassium channel [Salimicrobium halophilum]